MATKSKEQIFLAIFYTLRVFYGLSLLQGSFEQYQADVDQYRVLNTAFDRLSSDPSYNRDLEDLDCSQSKTPSLCEFQLLELKHMTQKFEASLPDLVQKMGQVHVHIDTERNNMYVIILNLLHFVVQLFAVWSGQRNFVYYCLFSPVLGSLTAFVSPKLAESWTMASLGRSVISGPVWTDTFGTYGSILVVLVFIIPMLESLQEYEELIVPNFGGTLLEDGLCVPFLVCWCFMVFVYYEMMQLLKAPLKSAKTRTKSSVKRDSSAVGSNARKEVTQRNAGLTPFLADPSWFFHCCLYNLKDHVKFILKTNPDFDINAQEGFLGNTGLHLAIRAESGPLVQVLLGNIKRHRSIDLGIRNTDGETALELAMAQDKDSMAHLILGSKHFRWNIGPDLFELVKLAVQSDKWTLAWEMAEKRPDYQFQCPNTRIILERGDQIWRQLKTDRTLMPKPWAEKAKNLLVYKSVLIGPPKDAPPTPESTNLLEDVKDVFECYVCFEMMVGVKIFSCSNDHWICANCCANPTIVRCPKCQESFGSRAPKRCITAETLASKLALPMLATNHK